MATTTEVRAPPPPPPPTITTRTTTSAVKYNTVYLRKPAGILRIVKAVLALIGIISCSEGLVCGGAWNDSFFIFVSAVSLIHSIFIVIVIVLGCEKKITGINVPLSLFLDDSIQMFVYLFATLMMMLAIGRCHFMIGARIVATLSGIAGFLTLVGLSYTDYRWWKGEETPDSWETKQNDVIPVTSSSPTVLTLS